MEKVHLDYVITFVMLVMIIGTFFQEYRIDYIAMKLVMVLSIIWATINVTLYVLNSIARKKINSNRYLVRYYDWRITDKHIHGLYMIVMLVVYMFVVPKSEVIGFSSERYGFISLVIAIITQIYVIKDVKEFQFKKGDEKP